MNEVERLRADQSRSAGARTIPDGAAELVAKRMLRIKLYGVALSARYDWQAHRQWTQQLTDDERADWLRDARALLADLGATPTTGPAPAAADECSCNGGWAEDQNYQPEDYERNDRLVPEKGLIPCGSCNHGGWDAPWPPEPAAPQAPAQPTGCPDCHETAPDHKGWCIKLAKPMTLASGPAAREDTAPPAWTGHNVTVAHLNGYYARCDTCPQVYDAKSQEDAEDWADQHAADTLRPSAPAVDGDTPSGVSQEGEKP